MAFGHVFYMKSFCLKFLFVLFSCCFVVGVVYQIYLKLTFSYETTIVRSDVMEKKAEGIGVIFKDEVVLNSSEYVGIVKNNFCNGARVAAKSEVAKSYTTQDDISKIKQVGILDKEISALNEAQNPGSLQDMNIKTINKQMNCNYYELIRTLKNCNLNTIKETKDQLTMLFNKKQIITNQVTDFNDTIAKLTSEKNNVNKTISSKPKSIITSVSGYFVDYTDGYEDKCLLKLADDFNAERLNQLYNECQKGCSRNNVGKVITNSLLIFKVVLPTRSVSDVKLGSECKIKFEEAGEEVTAKLTKLDLDWNSEQSVATFKIDVMTERLSSIRSSKAEIVFQTYRGIKVPKTAIRNNDEGDVGVYSLNNVSMQFKKVDILFEDENNVLCVSRSDDTAAYLRDFDKIITQGKDLYDNKPIR